MCDTQEVVYIRTLESEAIRCVLLPAEISMSERLVHYVRVGQFLKDETPVKALQLALVALSGDYRLAQYARELRERWNDKGLHELREFRKLLDCYDGKILVRELGELEEFLKEKRTKALERFMRRLIPVLIRFFHFFMVGPQRTLSRLYGACSGYRNNRRLLSTTWPWNIKAALVVLWGVCWMFMYLSGSEVPWKAGKGLEETLLSGEVTWESCRVLREVSTPIQPLSTGTPNPFQEGQLQDINVSHTPVSLNISEQEPPTPNISLAEVASLTFSDIVTLSSRPPSSIMQPSPSPSEVTSPVLGDITTLSIQPSIPPMQSPPNPLDVSMDNLPAIPLSSNVQEGPLKSIQHRTCRMCGEEFRVNASVESAVRRHEREQHGLYGGVLFRQFCPISGCKRASGKPFTRKDNLKQHMILMHRI